MQLDQEIDFFQSSAFAVNCGVAPAPASSWVVLLT
jgi:hypothetical protein